MTAITHNAGTAAATTDTELENHLAAAHAAAAPWLRSAPRNAPPCWTPSPTPWMPPRRSWFRWRSRKPGLPRPGCAAS